MGKGATKANATIQYCMTYARMLLQTLEIPSVSQFRASDDYQWVVGMCAGSLSF